MDDPSAPNYLVNQPEKNLSDSGLTAGFSGDSGRVPGCEFVSPKPSPTNAEGCGIESLGTSV